MITEKYNKTSASSIDIAGTKNIEVVDNHIIGEYFDEAIMADGSKHVIHNWKKNLIVAAFGKLLAALCKSHPGHSGIGYWEVGTGNESWDTPPLPQPQLGDVALLTPLVRVPVTIVFLDAGNNETPDVTNKIEMRAYFDENTANGPLREFGVFGGDASSILGTGIMCDRVIHQVVNKNSNMALQRKLRFTF